MYEAQGFSKSIFIHEFINVKIYHCHNYKTDVLVRILATETEY